MLTGVKDGRTLSLTWPKALPKPTLAENVATYAEVLPGVDLQLKAEVEGFSQLLVVKTAEAAKNPELALLKFELDMVGVTVSTDPDTGTVEATNPAGQTVFTSPSPLMWDSTSISSADGTPATRSTSEGETPADQFTPPAGAQDALMPTAVSGDTLEIKPDQGLLTGADTQYPVYIDPSWSWSEKPKWTRIYKKYPDNSYWNSNEDLRVGYEAESGGSNRISRSFVQVNIADLKGAQIKSATFSIKNTWSWSCQSRPVELYSVGPISKKTTWNNKPAKGALLDTVNDSKGWSKDCAAGNLEFNATSAVANAASKGAASINLGLYATEEDEATFDTYSWKRFDPKSIALDVVYNNPPKKPTGLGTNPRTSCSSGGLIGNAKVSVYAKIDDKDAGNLTAQFQVFKAGSTTPAVDKVIPAAKGKVATLPIPDGDLPTGDWTWKVRAKDQDGAYSPWSATCKFSIDRTRPSKPPVITSEGDKFPPGDAGWPAITGKAREVGKFTFAANGVLDVDHYAWWTDYDPEVKDAKPGVPATVSPPGYGPHFVYAYSVDMAGNRSDTETYLYYATGSGSRDVPTDLNGDGNSDIWSIDSNGTLLTYAGQANGDFATATNGGNAFPNSSVDSRGDWTQDGYNDLVALQYDDVDQKKKLWRYPNNGRGIIGDDYTELTVPCPVKDPDLNCDYGEEWTGDDHWHNAEQIVTPGDLNSDGHPDVLVKQGKQLWAYYGKRNTSTLAGIGRRPVLVGNGDWNVFTVIAPGDVSGDTIPDLWLRHNTTGDIYRTNGKEGEVKGSVDVTTWGNSTARVKIGTGFNASTYPAIGSVGDITGDGIADLWARKADNTMSGWAGKTPGADNMSFGATFVIDGITGGSRIPTGTTLAPGQSMTSRSAKLTMQDDGNLVVISNSGKVLWSTGTAGNVGAKAVMGASGNLTVYKADGATVLWQSETVAAEGYALLQDRGNLVIYNAKGQPQWSSGTAVRQDYNADGRSDIAAWYDYPDGHDAVHTFLTNSTGTFNAPFTGWTKETPDWHPDLMKKITGDYNGDGISDLAAAYQYTDGIKLWTWLGKADGTFNKPSSSWSGNWALDRMTLHSGDFNGDGRDDLAVWYRYGDGNKLWTFTANVRGGFNHPYNSWSTTGWNVANCKFVTGDFDANGRDDLAVLYNYDTSVKLWTFMSTTTGNFANPIASWTSTSWGDWSRTGVQSGDFNGDRRDDVATWYDYADGRDGIHTFISSSTTTDGKFAAPKAAWEAVPDRFTASRMQLTAGDYNGDGRDDLATMYGYADSTIKLFTWTVKPDGTFNEPATGWTSSSGWAGNSRVIKRYN